MRKLNNHSIKTKSALLASAAATLALSATCHAQSSDALIDKLVEKGILSTKEAQDLRDEADKNFTTAIQAKTGMPDWVTGYKLSGDFRGRFDQISGENTALVSRDRYRYRLRFGITASLLDNLEAGFRLGTGDSAGNPLSNNTTEENDFSKKPIWIDTAYGKWTPINSGGWMASATVGKMDNPFTVTPMVFDPDLTPEGVVLQGSYAINDKHTLAFTGAGFVLDEEKSSLHDPAMLGEQLMFNSKWNTHWASSAGLAAFQILDRSQLSNANVTENNQGNSRNAGGGLIYGYMPVVADANVTYTFDSAPLYNGAFPVKFGVEYMNNIATTHNNNGYWAGITLGKAGTHGTWELTYRYEYLQADAWYDQMVDDDNGVFYQNAFNGSSAGYFGGTNVKGHLFKLTYSFTDSMSFAFSAFVNGMVNGTVTGVNQPKADTLRVYADLLWKF
ncbi:MAG TPA: putative porin [Verrucomicrobiae bacterium]|nr:putative porin [Verrucomicrobiae bacterium]